MHSNLAAGPEVPFGEGLREPPRRHFRAGTAAPGRSIAPASGGWSWRPILALPWHVSCVAQRGIRPTASSAPNDPQERRTLGLYRRREPVACLRRGLLRSRLQARGQDAVEACGPGPATPVVGPGCGCRPCSSPPSSSRPRAPASRDRTAEPRDPQIRTPRLRSIHHDGSPRYVTPQGNARYHRLRIGDEVTLRLRAAAGRAHRARSAPNGTGWRTGIRRDVGRGSRRGRRPGRGREQGLPLVAGHDQADPANRRLQVLDPDGRRDQMAERNRNPGSDAARRRGLPLARGVRRARLAGRRGHLSDLPGSICGIESEEGSGHGGRPDASIRSRR